MTTSPVRSNIDQYPTITTSPVYSFLERIFRTCVFRLGVYENGYLEKGVFYLYKSCSGCKIFPEMFNKARAEKSLEIFKLLGAKEFFVTPQDQKASIHMITLKASDFEDKIKALGGSWEKLTHQGKKMLAIIPPKIPTNEWKVLEEICHLKMGWQKECVNKQDVIVTCHDADLINDAQWNKKCFLYSHSTSHSFTRDRARAGVYLGMKQDFCFFDNRGIWKSQGIPSEAGFYSDIDAVYKKLLEETRYTPQQIWLSGFCGGAPVAAYLKKQLHDQGVNFIEEQSFSNFKRDYIHTQVSLARWLALWLMGALSSKDIPEMGKPAETHFNVEKLWKDLKQNSSGKIILIHASNDQRLSEQVVNHYESLAHQVNSSVKKIIFTSSQGIDAHSDHFFKYPEAKRAFVSAIFTDSRYAKRAKKSAKTIHD